MMSDYYTLTVKTNLFEPLYFDRYSRLTLFKDKQAAFSENIKSKLDEKVIKRFLVDQIRRKEMIPTIHVHGSNQDAMITDDTFLENVLTVEFEFIVADLSIYRREIYYSQDKIYYTIPSPKQDIIDAIEKEIKDLKYELSDKEDEKSELETSIERIEDQIRAREKDIERLENEEVIKP